MGSCTMIRSGLPVPPASRSLLHRRAWIVVGESGGDTTALGCIGSSAWRVGLCESILAIETYAESVLESCPLENVLLYAVPAQSIA